MDPGHNCTNYAAYKLIQNGVDASYLRGHGNAYEWGGQASAHGVRVDRTPAVGAIAWWSAADTSSGSGHVAYVEQVRGDGSIVTSEDNFGGDFYWKVRTPSSYPTGFIHFKDLGAGGGAVDGSFVSYQGNVYRMAGGAPVYVSSWNSFGGPQPTTPLSDAQWASLRPVPADGTFIAASGRGDVYRIAGGAPLYVSSWNSFGGSQPVIYVDPWAIDNAGHPLSHLRPLPADGTFIVASSRGDVFRIAGGAPIYVSSWTPFGGVQPVVYVDPWAIDNAGNPASHMRTMPADGTFIAASSRGDVYRVAGGAPIYVSSWTPFGGVQPITYIDPWAIDNVGNPASHMRATPADGTFIAGLGRGEVYRIAGGAPIYVSSWAQFGGAQPVTEVDEWSIDHASDYHAHLHVVPTNGTVLQGAASNRYYRTKSGHASYLRAPSAATKRAAVAVDENAVKNAGIAGVWSHLHSGRAVVKFPAKTSKTKNAKATFTWSAPRQSSAFTTAGGRYAYARAGHKLGAWHKPSSWSGTKDRSLTLRLVKGYRYCVQVRGHNRAGITGKWSATQCVTRR